MNVYYISILLFAIPLNILVSSTKKNPSIITPHHTPRYTSRVLSEKEIKSTNYDNDPQMKKVMKKFQDRTSERLREYDERMKEKRQKSKEERDKNIQKIIEKDKMDKSLAQKIEKGCLRCGCALGGGVLPVWGLVSGLWYATWSQYVAIAVSEAATNAGIKAGVKVGLTNVTKIVTELSKDTLVEIPSIEMLETLTTGISANDVTLLGIFKTIHINGCGTFESGTYALFSTWVQNMTKPIRLKSFSAEAEEVTKAFAEAKTGILTKASNATSSLTTAITVSIIAIVVIVLVMLIIYLILRYRRKKKMKKKLQYTKLLKE
ncbi:hypothetical protein PFUGPA_00141 [Plasmodium falciparum Palo Alto/Uganda]|uniref:Rifin n=2 Tax=Plasmodium falciparum TaxID=5833 RepID=W4J7U4_PLAFP|nr:hypothetical protein PFUGPA_00141 [Plasmodium falciparum Palo Alto/Uganda]ETW63908.1 hypothetical protein PFMC_00143 [Plasmodium falciparum CAMP/Malaysia]